MVLYCLTAQTADCDMPSLDLEIASGIMTGPRRRETGGCGPKVSTPRYPSCVGARSFPACSRTKNSTEIFAECRELHPDSWNIYRETTGRTATGLAAGEEFWARVKGLGDKQYYVTIDMEGMPN